MPIRLAILCEYTTLNGGEQSLLSVLDDLARRGVMPRVTMVAPPEGRFADAVRSRGIDLEPFELLREDGTRLPREQIQRQLIDTLHRLSPDLVHANSLSMGRLLGSVRGEIACPCLTHIRDIVGVSRAAASHLNRLDQLVAVSHATREFHIAQGVDAEKLTVVYNGVDVERFSPGERTRYLNRELDLPPDAFLVASIGQIGLRKAQDVLAAAAVKLSRAFPSAHYLFVGERNSTKEENITFERRLHRQFDEGGLASRVHFLGYRDDLPELLREIDLLIHTARQEPLGRVLLEAGAAGVPIVATDVGGTREIFLAGEAVLVPPDDADVLAREIAGVMRDERRRRALGELARRRIATSFTVATAANALLHVWLEYRL